MFGDDSDFPRVYSTGNVAAGYASDFDDDFDAYPVSEPEAPQVAEDDFPPPFTLSGVDLLSPPGFVGRVANWIDSQCRYPRRRLAVASAIATVGNIGGLRHEDARDGVTANMLVFCVAASATGKEAVQQAMAQLHVAAGVHYALQGGIKSEQEIMRNLIEHQAAFYIVDEIGIFLSKVRNAQQRGGAAYLEGVFGSIMSAYSKANSRLLLQGDTKRDLRKGFASALSAAQDAGNEAGADRASRMLKMIDEGLERPFLSVVGYTTPSTFEKVMDGETATQGFVGRALIVNEKDANPQERDAFKKPPMSENLANRLMQIHSGGVFDMMDNGTGNPRVEFDGDRDRIETGQEASEMLSQVSKWLWAYADHMGEHAGEAAVAMIRRAYEMVAKVSFILAIPDGGRTADHVRWAFAYVRAELDAKVKLVFANDNAKDRPEESIAARVLNILDTEKGISLAVISNRLHLKPADMEPILDKMALHGLVCKKEGTRRYKGAKMHMWFSLG